jgi:hypothetical protein
VESNLPTGSPTRAPRVVFKHRPTPLHMQIAFGAYVYGLLTPVVRVLEALGLAERPMTSSMKRRARAYAAHNPLRDYVPGPEDVFVATYAKSGTNWMMQIVYQLIHHGAGQFDHIHDVIPWPDTQAMSSLLRDYAIPLEDADEWRDAPEPLRVIKTHCNWDSLPKSDRARYIMVIRDPKDVFVSSYFFFRDAILGPAMPSVATWYKLFLAGRTIGGSWAANAAGYWAERRRKNVLVVSFQSMTRDLAGTIRRVADFLGIACSKEVLDAVFEKSSFPFMKQIDHKFQIGKLIPWRKAGPMLRKGAQGGSSELLTRDQQRAIDALCISELRWLRSDLPYEEFADLA